MAYPKRKPFKPGYRSLSREEAKMVSWCIKNSISCCVIPARKAETGGYDFCIEIIINGKSNYSPSFKKGNGNFQVEIIINGKSNLSPCFEKDEVLVKQLEYYKYYYDKYNKISK